MAEQAISDDLVRVAQLIEGACTIAISGHTNPDGDALGSCLGLAHLILQRWPEKRVTTLLADDAAVPTNLAFIPGAASLIPASAYEDTPDLFVSVDTPNVERLHNSARVLEQARTTAALDHHITMEEFAQACVKRPNAAACALVVCDLARVMGVTPSVDAATCLLTGIITDTGRFQYQNADVEVFTHAAHLVECGASPSQIAQAVYQSASLQSLHLRARAFDRLTTDESGRVGFSYITLSDLAELNARPEDCDALIDAIRELGNIDACLFFRERESGGVRVNLRAKVDWLDVAAVAGTFGGGGHRAAAGLTYEGSLQDALKDVVSAVSQAVRTAQKDR